MGHLLRHLEKGDRLTAGNWRVAHLPGREAQWLDGWADGSKLIYSRPGCVAVGAPPRGERPWHPVAGPAALLLPAPAGGAVALCRGGQLRHGTPDAARESKPAPKAAIQHPSRPDLRPAAGTSPAGKSAAARRVTRTAAPGGSPCAPVAVPAGRTQRTGGGFASPEECPSRCRVVINDPGPRREGTPISGTCSMTGASRSTAPRSPASSLSSRSQSWSSRTTGTSSGR